MKPQTNAVQDFKAGKYQSVLPNLNSRESTLLLPLTINPGANLITNNFYATLNTRKPGVPMQWTSLEVWHNLSVTVSKAQTCTIHHWTRNPPKQAMWYHLWQLCLHCVHWRGRPKQNSFCSWSCKVAIRTSEMLVAKILFNSFISTPGPKFMTMDMSNFYLMTPLLPPNYIHIKLTDLPDEIINDNNLTATNEVLEKCLNKHSYYQSKYIPGLLKHQRCPIHLCLTVDDSESNILDKIMQITRYRSY